MRYYCKDCKEFFKTPNIKHVSDLHGEVDSRQDEEYDVELCPRCGGDYFARAEECVVCGTTIKPALEMCMDCTKDYVALFTAMAEIKSVDYVKILDGATVLINKEDGYVKNL